MNSTTIHIVQACAVCKRILSQVGIMFVIDDDSYCAVCCQNNKAPLTMEELTSDESIRERVSIIIWDVKKNGNRETA